ncbi:G-type lectin S-receptor-like serine/threonine-protein kinase At1g11330 [Neltuma alba]|uniref:G-type lectin S-receptor-like serine/threonine-protein kinase At1g11330 n=1 Tax=Neltuma alba TaxID=207710 RepID=UPI0010A58473|nr:G-type lectin S-receptor-like serine/threonine-protein kinase At1g11330 [Prosopis alba]
MRFFCRYTILLAVLIIFCCSCFDFCSAKDTIKSSQHIKDPETVSSNGSFFMLGFFSPENTTNRYVGIWYKSQSNIIWVANRNQPLTDSSGTGTIAISEDGNLVVINGENHIIWSSNVSNIALNTTCQLLDSGNLVLKDSAENILWESFAHPSDSFLPQMKLTRNKRTGEKLRLTSWKSLSDPSMGNFFITLERPDIPEIFIWNGDHPYWRSGPWNGRIFTGIYYMNALYLKGFRIIEDGEGTIYVSFSFSDVTEFTLFVLDFQGVIYEKDWFNDTIEPQKNHSIQTSECDIYGLCGSFGSCNANSSPICNCLRGFEPSKRKEWDMQNWTNGCERKTTLQCEMLKNRSAQGKQDGFYKLQMVKVPDFAELSSASEETCRSQCLENCTCIAYSYSPEIGCMSWKGNLIDIQQFSTGGLDLYVRLAHSDLEKETHARKIIIITVIIGTLIIAFGTYVLWKRIVKHSETKSKNKWFLRLKKDEEYLEKTEDTIIGQLSRVKLPEVLAYDFEKVATATNNFDLSNKLGQGGFGPVYKGILQDSQNIAVKRLSRASGQGLEEFMNEVIVISKLQHRNLVKLIGCCIEGGEKMLIYEYMPNKSLDAFIFDPLNKKVLDWGKRFDIIGGIARGMLYLHRDSRLKIIHRDLKASNILLDENLNPKISDFGMARIFQGSEDQANTRRVVGTYGYMSPEYAIEGLFSEKSDVFSFGVLLLEIATGRRNSSLSINEDSLSLLGLTWKLWNEENASTLIDPRIYDNNLEKDILRCIHIGLLCVQELARERPSMSTVVSMLSSEIVNLPSPKQPAFIEWQSLLCSSSNEESQRLFTNNSVSVTEIHGR